jgi:hypothetical protein
MGILFGRKVCGEPGYHGDAASMPIEKRGATLSFSESPR